MNDLDYAYVIQQVQERLAQGKRPTMKQTEMLLSRLQVVEALLTAMSPALNDVEAERDAYTMLARTRTEMLESLSRDEQGTTSQLSQGLSLSSPLPATTNWQYNLREFFELNMQGWRAIVSSDSEDPVWIAYVERGGMRFYAPSAFDLIQDALRWCEMEIIHQLEAKQEELQDSYQGSEQEPVNLAGANISS